MPNFRYLDGFRPDEVFTSRVEEEVAFVAGYSRGSWVTCALLLPVENVAKDRRRDFSISMEAFVYATEEAQMRGLDIVGFVHSHPAGYHLPTRTDIDGCPEGFYGAVYHVPSTRLTWYDRAGNRWPGPKWRDRPSFERSLTTP